MAERLTSGRMRAKGGPPAGRDDVVRRQRPPQLSTSNWALQRSLRDPPATADPLLADRIAALQATHGNQFVKRLVEGTLRLRDGGKASRSGLPAQAKVAVDAGTIQRTVGEKAENLTAKEKTELGVKRAFTTGKDIFIRQGEYNAGSSSGQEVLAHELTHVVQQSALSRLLIQRGRSKPKIEEVTNTDFPDYPAIAASSSMGGDGYGAHASIALQFRQEMTSTSGTTETVWSRHLIDLVATSATKKGGPQGIKIRFDQNPSRWKDPERSTTWKITNEKGRDALMKALEIHSEAEKHYYQKVI